MKIIRLRRELYASSSHSECSYERIQLDMMKCVNRSLAVHTFYIECQSCHHAACAGGGGAPFIVVLSELGDVPEAVQLPALPYDMPNMGMPDIGIADFSRRLK